MFKTNKLLWKEGDRVKFISELDTDTHEWIQHPPLAGEGPWAVSGFNEGLSIYPVELVNEQSGFSTVAHPLELEKV